MRKRDPNEKKRTPQPLANVVGAFLRESKLEERVEQASVVPEWELLVGKQIARVTKPIPSVGVVKMVASAELASSVLRIMMPAFA